jgi:hypothetical protein
MGTCLCVESTLTTYTHAKYASRQLLLLRNTSRYCTWKQAGGELCQHGWKPLIILVHDFLFSTAIRCAELAEELALAVQDTGASAMPASAREKRMSESEMRDRVFHAFSSSHIVWLQSKEAESSQSIRAAKICSSRPNRQILDRPE